jgi:hypothetical protein
MLQWQRRRFLGKLLSNNFSFRTDGFISFRRLPKRWSYPNPFNNIAMRYRWVFCFSSVYKSKLLTQLRNKKPCPENRDRVCAQNRNRTCTSLRTLDFESSASTNSAIWAGLQYYAINENLPKYDLGIFSCSNTPLFAAFLLGK